MGQAGPTDEVLMRQYVVDGERGAFEALFRRYAVRLNGYFLRTVGSESLAQDMVQQTFLHVHRARADFRQGAPFRPWLYAIAANVRREHFRKRYRRPETQLDPAVHGEPTTAPATSTRTDRLVRRALDALPESQREVVVLHWYEELSFAEIAELVGASRSAVKVRAHRAYNKLRQVLGEG